MLEDCKSNIQLFLLGEASLLLYSSAGKLCRLARNTKNEKSRGIKYQVGDKHAKVSNALIPGGVTTVLFSFITEMDITIDNGGPSSWFYLGANRN